MNLREGFKKTDIGVIPSDWETKRLSEITDPLRPISYGIVQTGPLVSNGIPCLRVLDISNGQINKTELITTTENISESYRRTVLRDKDLVMPLRGKVGDVGLVDADLIGANLTRGVALIAVNPNWVPEFVRFAISAPFTCRRLGQAMNGSALQEIPIASLRAFEIALPSLLDEQRAIAATLSDVDVLIAGLEKLIAKKYDLKQAAMQKLLTGQNRLLGFSGEWVYAPVHELEVRGLLKLSRGNVISKNDIASTPGEYPIYSSSIHNNGEFGRYGKYMFDEELITWSVDGGGDFFYRPAHKFSVTNVCGFMRASTTHLNYRFLAFQLQQQHSQKNFDYQTKAHPSVVRSEYVVAVPSLDEQTCIANLLSDMGTDIANLESRLAKTRDLKQGMMQELLTGRTRLV